MNMNMIQDWANQLSDKSKHKIIKVLDELEEGYLLTPKDHIFEWSPSNEFQDKLIVKLRDLQILDITHQISDVCWLRINHELLKQALKFLREKRSLMLTDKTIFWPNEFEWNEKEKSLFLAGSDRIRFSGDRLKLFRELALNKGEWVRKDRLVKVIEDGGNTEKDIWSIVPQMNRRIKNDGYSQKIKIVSATKDGISYFRLQPLLS